jgi:hypothetical protein
VPVWPGEAPATEASAAAPDIWVLEVRDLGRVHVLLLPSFSKV